MTAASGSGPQPALVPLWNHARFLFQKPGAIHAPGETGFSYHAFPYKNPSRVQRNTTSYKAFRGDSARYYPSKLFFYRR